VTDLLVARALELAGAALDRALDVVLRHALRLRLLDRETQAGIRCRIAAAAAGPDRDLSSELRAALAALSVLRALPEPCVGPCAVPGHVTALRCLRCFASPGRTAGIAAAANPPESAAAAARPRRLVTSNFR